MKFEFGASFPMPIAPRVAKQFRTVRSIADAILELVTNSDDSYNRLHKLAELGGVIEVYVERLKGGKCKKLVVTDFAEGMDREQLQKAITFGEDSSRFSEAGRSVRGLFGRGLKEAIIALGEGEITTIHNGMLDVAKIWRDPGSWARCSLITNPMSATQENRKEIAIEQGNGTRVAITVTNEEVNCPDYETLKQQLTNHYALRDINMSDQRKVIFTLQSETRKSSIPIHYISPEAKCLCEKTVKLPKFGDSFSIKVLESAKELQSPRHNPFGKAGLLIKTEGTILDNQLFRYENERAACYFYGEVFCRGIADRLRAGDFGLIDLNRLGLNWRHDPYCQTLQSKIEEVLAPYIERKKGELEKIPPTGLSPRTKRMLDDICHLLNTMAKKELSEVLPTDGDGDEKPSPIIDKLMVKPEAANLEIDTPRFFSVYAPQDILGQSLVRNDVEVESDNPNIEVLDALVKLSPHREYPHLYYGRFRCIGRLWGEEAWITCTLGTHEAVALVRVAPLGERRKRRTLAGQKGGFFSSIESDETENPMQRVSYDSDTGRVKIYIKFPAVRKYLGPGLEGSESPAGSTMLAELVGEAFCKEVARRDIEAGKYFSEIDGFNTAVNDLQRKYLHKIHDLVKRQL